jgi:thiamine-phosphate pyrophosphorylase
MNTSFGTYLVTQSNQSRGRPTAAVVRAAIAGGIDVVQLREKHASVRERLAVGEELRRLTREAGVTFVVNDRVDLAVAVDADGVHLGDDDLPVGVARDQLGADALVGRSVSTVDGAERAERDGADYLGVGAIYRTGSKETDPEQTEIGLERVEAVCDAVSIPVVGIGGVTHERAGDVVGAGADGVAVVSEITAADDPEAATRRLVEAVAGGRVRP